MGLAPGSARLDAETWITIELTNLNSPCGSVTLFELFQHHFFLFFNPRLIFRYRAEVIGALTSVLLIWVVTGILVYMAVNRVIEPDFTIDSTIMLISSGLGVVVNIM